MYRRAGEVFERPFIRQSYDAEDEVDDLEDRYRFDGEVEVLGEEVEEEFGPKETLERGCYLVCDKAHQYALLR